MLTLDFYTSLHYIVSFTQHLNSFFHTGYPSITDSSQSMPFDLTKLLGSSTNMHTNTYIWYTQNNPSITLPIHFN